MTTIDQYNSSVLTHGYAGFWRRLSAHIWDALIIGAAVSMLIIVPAVLGGMQPTLQFVKALGWIEYIVLIAYYVYFEGVRGGTPGKMVVGLTIRNERNEIIGIPRALLRIVGKMISTLILGIGFLMVVWDQRKQGLHDKIAGTFVIKTKDRRGLVITAFVVVGLLLVTRVILEIAMMFLAPFGF